MYHHASGLRNGGADRLIIDVWLLFSGEVIRGLPLFSVRTFLIQRTLLQVDLLINRQRAAGDFLQQQLQHGVFIQIVAIIGDADDLDHLRMFFHRDVVVQVCQPAALEQPGRGLAVRNVGFCEGVCKTPCM